MQYLELAKQYVKPEQVFQIGLIVRGVSVLANVALFASFANAPESASTSLIDNLKHLYAWGSSLIRLAFDVASLPLIGFWAYALLVEGAVDYTETTNQYIAYGLGIFTIVSAAIALLASFGYVNTFTLADIVGTITLGLQGSFPAIVQILPAAGFAWLAYDATVEDEDAIEDDDDVEVDPEEEDA